MLLFVFFDEEIGWRLLTSLSGIYCNKEIVGILTKLYFKQRGPVQDFCHNIWLGQIFRYIVNSLRCEAQSGENDRIYHN